MTEEIFVFVNPRKIAFRKKEKHKKGKYEEKLVIIIISQLKKRQKFVGQQTSWFRSKIKNNLSSDHSAYPALFSEESKGTLRCQACPTHRVCPSQKITKKS